LASSHAILRQLTKEIRDESQLLLQFALLAHAALLSRKALTWSGDCNMRLLLLKT
jgi:hypothetical protein